MESSLGYKNLGLYSPSKDTDADIVAAMVEVIVVMIAVLAIHALKQ